MREFLFVFGYETPSQKAHNDSRGWDDEDSQVIFIRADDEDSAVRWGRQIAQRFYRVLHNDPEADWGHVGYAAGIEDPEGFTQAQLHAAPRVDVGECPNLEAWVKDALGN